VTTAISEMDEIRKVTTVIPLCSERPSRATNEGFEGNAESEVSCEDTPDRGLGGPL
jgi:hypothetical protein